ncbi:FkbM family methyltransferase [Spirosoma aerolatum]|uniref:FkbM family methyltransferase n=1 Tax=Spirosoma aerolatum TaxID=1211326 RepID=UPI0009AE82F7|nr:FkbM family methyltransferase [Spirosoma aerolatum]
MKQVQLPNGLRVAALNKTEADVLYHEIFAMQSYQQHGIRLADGDCVFDVGANIGLYSIFLTQTYPNLKLFAFEPIPALYAVLQQNARLLFSTVNARLFNIGLSDRAGTARFTFQPSLSMTASMYPGAIADSSQKKASAYAWMQALIGDMARVGQLPTTLANWLTRSLARPYLRLPVLGLLSIPILSLSVIQRLRKQQIDCILKTISDIIREQNIDRIDVMKIDVEGSELDVVRGINDADWPKIRQFIIEVHDLDNRVTTLTALFQQRGFRTIVDQEDWQLHRLMNIYTLYAMAD